MLKIFNTNVTLKLKCQYQKFKALIVIFLDISYSFVFPETNEDGLDYIGYRISMPYSSIIKIVADFGHSDTDSIYFWLKHPATVRRKL